ncbi:hypothetical protein MBLNU230_g2472t1 [Neophaeotheca triangularis]
MAGLAASPRRPTRTPGRPLRPQPSIEAATEPPNKKRKYIPGGPGGGGRWLDSEGNEVVRGEYPGVQVPRTAPRRPRRTSMGAGEDVGDTPTAARSALQSRPRRETRERPARYAPQVSTPRPRYSSAAAAAAASQTSEGYKPREERTWDEFHKELNLSAPLLIFTADEVDGRKPQPDYKKPDVQLRPSSPGSDNGKTSGDVDMADAPAEVEEAIEAAPLPAVITPKRKPGRPPRRPESMLTGLGSPPTPKILPLPTHNPKERLNLPKPSFRLFSHFLQFEEDLKENKVNYVDRTMANVGYQESDRFELPSKALVRLTEGQQIEDEADLGLRLESDGLMEVVPTPAVSRVEYDMDEQDEEWLNMLNESRKQEGVDAIKPAIFEITMTQIEKEYHALEKRIPKPQPRHAQTHRPRSSSQAAVNGDPNPPGDEPDSKCSICDDGDCENANAIIFCDGCDLAVHQECYGVPFIPEGQWFCRKCKEIGRGTPTCIFCPNVDGAFKQTSTLRWSHLLCSIWIPEVTIGNMTFMEPITDVEKVPKSRWKLQCYICNQKMGACIQCGNKNCYLAFHVTCARKAKLFLKMKSQHQGGIDASALKAFCDKHVPPEWRRTHDTDQAILDAKQWYRHAMKDRKWADSQSTALDLGAPPPPDGGMSGEVLGMEDTIAVSSQRRKRAMPQKLSWRLPSGAPVVPAVVYNTVELSMARFNIRKRKEFVEKACRYWTLKREARRGAALLKRLQLQLESFSSMEITRRNFAGMGAAGRPRLQRRIEFAELLQSNMGPVTEVTALTKQREILRLQELELLQELVDTIYFPITPLLKPILQRALKLDEKSRVFSKGFETLAFRLRERYYTSVSDFSRDLTQVFATVLAEHDNINNEDAADADITAIHDQLMEVKPGTAEHMALTQEQKDLKRLAKRIVKAVKEPLEDAMRKEADLRGRELNEEMQRLDRLMIFAGDGPKSGDISMIDGDVNDSRGEKQQSPASAISATAGADQHSPQQGEDVVMSGVETNNETNNETAEDDKDVINVSNSMTQRKASDAHSCASSSHSHETKTQTTKPCKNPTAPLSPPTSTSPSANPNVHANAAPLPDSHHDILGEGGIPRYLEPFDIMGTTVHEERYTGRAVLRDMSEELSDIDDVTLTELAGEGPGEADAAGEGGKEDAGKGVDGEDAAEAPKKKAPKKKKTKGRRSMWSRAR